MGRRASGWRRGSSPASTASAGSCAPGSTRASYGEDGWLGCGVVVDPAAVVDAKEEGGNQLVVARTPKGQPATWYAGSGWDRSGDFPDVAAWDRHLDAFTARLRSPLKVEVLR